MSLYKQQMSAAVRSTLRDLPAAEKIPSTVTKDTPIFTVIIVFLLGVLFGMFISRCALSNIITEDSPTNNDSNNK